MKLLERNGVWFYQSDLLPCPHGFSTRVGGVSREAHTSSLNLGYGRGDADDVVRENLTRFSLAVGVSPESVVSLPQVHGAEVISVTGADCGEGYFRKSERTGDGYCTVDPEVTLGIKTADCVPILLCGLDACGAPIIVSALHAGWRGTVSRIAANGVDEILAVGIPASNIRAAIGPSIGACCYEVDAAFYAQFCEAFGTVFLDGTFTERPDGKYTADLREINRRVLMEKGVLPTHIDVSEACTFCRPDRFYSHRYSGGVRGTMLSLIALPSAK